jgi:dipeptidyl aminopeptidase/acylaminoacyl peptidase
MPMVSMFPSGCSHSYRNLRIERLRLAFAAALAVGLLGACDREPVHPSLSAAALPRLVPAHEFVFNQHGLGGFSFSPDGTRLAWYGPSTWRSALHVRLQSTGAVHVYRAGGSGRHWSADGRRLLILDDKSGAENHHLFRLDVDDPKATPVDLTPHPGVRVWLHQIPKSDPEHVLVLHNRRARNERDLYRINLTTGVEEVVAVNPGDGIVPMTDAGGKFLGWKKHSEPVRARGKPLPPELRDRSALSRRTPEMVRTIGVSADQTQAWILSNRHRDRVALFHADAVKKELSLVHEEPNVDIGRVVTSEATGKPLVVASNDDYPRMKVLDAQLEADLQPVLARFDGTRYGFDIVTMDRSERRLVVTVFTHAQRHYYLLDRDAKQASLLGTSRPASFSEAMVLPEAVAIPARDGLRLPAYLLLPPGGQRPLPLVLLVHGGPWSRVAWSDPDGSEDMLRAQFLANRGYAVLVVNFRGSSGYGRSFMAAAVGQFGAAMQDDLLDALAWALERGIADPNKVAVMGHSYGGYATLMALAQQPRMFACGVDIGGPTDLVRLVEEFPVYWELAYWYSYVGDPAVASDRERMQRASPVAIADQIEAPVLIMQGRKDVRVPEAQSAALVERLRQHGKPFEYVLIDDMGHSTGWWAHHLLLLRRTEAFLARCLGGRAARFDRMEWAARLTGRLPLWR